MRQFFLISLSLYGIVVFSQTSYTVVNVRGNVCVNKDNHETTILTPSQKVFAYDHCLMSEESDMVVVIEDALSGLIRLTSANIKNNRNTFSEMVYNAKTNYKNFAKKQNSHPQAIQTTSSDYDIVGAVTRGSGKGKIETDSLKFIGTTQRFSYNEPTINPVQIFAKSEIDSLYSISIKNTTKQALYVAILQEDIASNTIQNILWAPFLYVSAGEQIDLSNYVFDRQGNYMIYSSEQPFKIQEILEIL